ncbi:MAG: TIM-barrel domain-containing protein [Nitriliruptoraceae bacterium]
MQGHHEGVVRVRGAEPLSAFDVVESAPGRAVVRVLGGRLEVTVHRTGTFRVRTLVDAPAPEYGILTDDGARPDPGAVAAPETGVDDAGAAWLRLRSGDAALVLRATPLRIELERDGRVLLGPARDRSIDGDLRFPAIARRDGGWVLAFELPSGERVHGLGEKWAALDRRGQRVRSWNEDATNVNSELSYKNTPFAWSPSGWWWFLHTPSPVEHGVGYPNWSHRTLVVGLEDPELDLFVGAHDGPEDVIARYTDLTGRASLPPVWSYGVWFSRAYYATAEDALAAAEGLRARRIPSEVLLLDGRAWHAWTTRFDFSWDPARYPDPAAFVGRLKDLGFRTNLWEYSYLSVRNPLFNELDEKGYFLRNPDGSTYIHRWFPWPFEEHYPWLPPSGIIDFTNPEAYAWFRDQHRDLIDLGVAVMKTDYGEAVPSHVVAHNGDTGHRLHNVYTLLYNRCVFEAFDRYGAGAPMVWGRSGWAGVQRAPVQWGGDPQCDWEGLAASVRGGLSWGMSGGPFYSHDIGGFARGQVAPELYVRWAQAGIHCSHTRFHGIGEREPWAYGDEAEGIVRRWCEWRMRLIPYLQACALESVRTGVPVMRAMQLAFPDDLAATQDLQYLLGPSLLVAPVVRADGRVRVVLPAGSRWCELATGTWHEGGTVLDLEVPLDTIPLFGREGHVLPLGPVVQHTGELDGPLVVDEVVAFGTPDVALDLPRVDADGRLDDVVTLAPDGAGGLAGLDGLAGAPTLTVR